MMMIRGFGQVDIELKTDERIDDLQLKGYRIIQNPNHFCFGIDAVLLSEFAYIKSGGKMLDLGTGTGIIPILMEAKTMGREFVGLEIQEDSVDMARRSLMLNGIEDKVSIVHGDIKEASDIFGRSSFDVVTSNPPYMINNHGLINPDLPKAIARHEMLCTLENIIQEAAALLVPGGHFFMVHRPFRLAEIFDVMIKYKLEPKRMRLVYPYIDKEPSMVLIEGIFGAKSRITVERPLIIYGEDGKYTKDIPGGF